MKPAGERVVIAPPPRPPSRRSKSARGPIVGLHEPKSFKSSNDEFDLEDFQIGEENHLAGAAVKKILAQPGGPFNPLFLYGSPAVGKSHLLFGLARALRGRRPGAEIVVLPAGDFSERCDAAWQTRTGGEFRRELWRADALLLDDLHLLARRPAALEELLHLFDRLSADGKQMVFTSQTPPAELVAFSAPLRNRFLGGLVVGLNPPRFDLLGRILKRYSEKTGLILSNAAAERLCKGVRSPRELLGALRTFEQTLPARTAKLRRVSIERVRAALDESVAEPLTVAEVAKAVCTHFRLGMAAVRSASRRQSLVEARQIAMYLARTSTVAPLTEVGAYFGGRDHSTVLYACRKTEDLLKTDARVARAAREIRRALREAGKSLPE